MWSPSFSPPPPLAPPPLSLKGVSCRGGLGSLAEALGKLCPALKAGTLGRLLGNREKLIGQEILPRICWEGTLREALKPWRSPRKALGNLGEACLRKAWEDAALSERAIRISYEFPRIGGRSKATQLESPIKSRGLLGSASEGLGKMLICQLPSHPRNRTQLADGGEGGGQGGYRHS